jgi:glycosyltransferase involved in cell wall biosynthesis
MAHFAVVVPTFNRAATLARAVESVLAQSCDDFELVVVDDGSTDGTRNVLEQFGDRVRVVTQQNAGVSAARNTGVSATASPWLVFLDSDDELVPEALSRYLEVADEAQLVVAGTLRVSPDGSKREAVVPDSALILRKRFTPLLAGAFAIRRDVFNRVGGYDDALAYAENTELAWRLRAELTEPGLIEVLSEPLAIVHERVDRGHARSRYDSAKLILERRSYELESEDTAARRNWHASYLCIAAISAAEIGRRGEAITLVSKAIVEQPFVFARYRSAGGVVRRILRRNR